MGGILGRALKGGFMAKIGAPDAPVRQVVAEMSDEEFGRWLAAYVDGSGTFNCWFRQDRATKTAPYFHLSKRLDDYDLLDALKNRVGIGYIYVSWRGTSKPQARWTITGTDDCMVIARLFTAYPLISRKNQKFEVWRKIVGTINRYNDEIEWERYRALYEQLKEAGHMPPPSQVAPELVDRANAAAGKSDQPLAT